MSASLSPSGHRDSGRGRAEFHQPRGNRVLSWLLLALLWGVVTLSLTLGAHVATAFHP